jgi:hypothetical protein
MEINTAIISVEGKYFLCRMLEGTNKCITGMYRFAVAFSV